MCVMVVQHVIKFCVLRTECVWCQNNRQRMFARYELVQFLPVMHLNREGV